jgi:hypothetical protein
MNASVSAAPGRIARVKRNTGRFFSLLNWLLSMGMLGAIIFMMSGAPTQITDWKEHTLVIHTDPSRQILDPSLRLTKEDFRQIDCLARNMYWEAATQGEAGMKAVGDVVYNRMHSGLFPDGICQVIYQGKIVIDPKTGERTVEHNHCQFSWYCDGKQKRVTDNVRWRMANEVAYNLFLYQRAMPDLTGGATYYHADYVHPDWSRLKQTIKIGAHLFYRADPGLTHGLGHKHRKVKKDKSVINSIDDLPMRKPADVPVSQSP